MLTAVVVSASLMFMTDCAGGCTAHRSIEFSARLTYQSASREEHIAREPITVDSSISVRNGTALRLLEPKLAAPFLGHHVQADNNYTNSRVLLVSPDKNGDPGLHSPGKDEMQGPEAQNKFSVNSRSKLVASILNSISDGRHLLVPEQLTALGSDYNFTLPCPGVYKPTDEVMQSYWVKPLLQLLSNATARLVTLVVANRAYEDILLNWLISATVTTSPPIRNIVVVAMDEGLHYLLQYRGIPSIYAAATSLFVCKHKFHRYFEIVMMTRLLFMRLINRLGFDCAMYDIDAIILRNPESLYDAHPTDIVGSRGALPKLLLKKWNVTICIGAVLIRSNKRTGNISMWITANSMSCIIVHEGFSC